MPIEDLCAQWHVVNHTKPNAALNDIYSMNVAVKRRFLVTCAAKNLHRI